MKRIRAVALVAGAILAATAAFAAPILAWGDENPIPIRREAKAPAGRRFEYKSKSEEARKLLFELQDRVENFQVGPANLELARKIVALDPAFAMGQYYLSAVTPGPEGETEYQKSRALGRKAPDGERRFIEALVHARTNQGVDFKKSIPPMEALAKDYPGERLVHVILGQLLNGDAQGEKARMAFERPGPPARGAHASRPSWPATIC